MKLTSLAILLSLLTVTAQAQTDTLASHKHISIISLNKEVFYFKADADFMGATVVVTDSKGTVFFSSEIHNRRNLIDFFYLKEGQYKIHFEHNGDVEDYQVFIDGNAPETAQFVALKSRA